MLSLTKEELTQKKKGKRAQTEYDIKDYNCTLKIAKQTNANVRIYCFQISNQIPNLIDARLNIFHISDYT